MFEFFDVGLELQGFGTPLPDEGPVTSMNPNKLPGSVHVSACIRVS
jgi:hypothetical protein